LDYIKDWKMGVETLEKDADGADAELQCGRVLDDLHFEGALFPLVHGGETITDWKDLGQIARQLNFASKYSR
jgi:hypothetical protein